MNRETFGKTIFAVALVAVLLAGFLHLTAEPAQALTCKSSFLGCPFSHIEVHNEAGCEVGCCIYQCPDGSTLEGLCAIL